MTSQIAQQQAIPATTADWAADLPFDQFDPSLGTLQSVNVGLASDLTGTLAIENLQPAPARVSATLLGDVEVSAPANGVVAAVAPEAYANASLGAYDGTTDYAGNSGTTLAISGSDATAITVAAVPAFVGSGTIALPINATSTLSVTGPANMNLEAGAAIGATTTLAYDYTPAGTQGTYDFVGYDFFPATDSYLPTLFWGSSSSLVQSPAQIFQFADSTAGWSNQVVAQQFDPSLGTLEAVNLTISGNILASVGAENLLDSAGAVATTQTIDVTLTIPMAGTVAPLLLPVSATVSNTMSLGAYDGTADFSGTSGQIDEGLTQTGSLATSLSGSELTDFLGTGTIDLPVATIGTATASGPGSLLLSLLADAGATVTLSYSYVPTDPIWSTPNVDITQAGTSTIDVATTIQSLVLDAPGATVVLDAPLDVTGGITVEAGTLLFAGGSLAVGSYLQTGGVVTGTNVDIVSAGSFVELGGRIAASGTVSLTAGTFINLGTIQSGTLGVIGGETAVAPGSLVSLGAGPSGPVTAVTTLGTYDAPAPTPVTLVGAGSLLVAGTLAVGGVTVQPAARVSAGALVTLTALYQQTLNRAPDVGGIDYWGPLLGNEIPASLVQASLATSAEARADIAAYYLQVLGRPVDSAGAAWWDAQLVAGLSLTAVESGLAFSGEAQADINAGYEHILNRPVDSGALAYWQSELSTGLPLSSVMSQIAYSGESYNDINAIYERILNRTVDGDGLYDWEQNLANGMSQATVVSSVAFSGEAQADINNLYLQILGRSVDSGGLAWWENQLDAGASLASVQASLAFSTEATTDIDAAYTNAYGSAPSSGTVLTLEGSLAAGAQLASIDTALQKPLVVDTVAAQAITDRSVDLPFAAAALIDPHLGETETATIVITGAAGTVTDANGLLSGSGLSEIGVGTYTLQAASASALSTALKAVVFTPTAGQVGLGQSVTSTLTVSGNDTLEIGAASVTNITATAVDSGGSLQFIYGSPGDDTFTAPSGNDVFVETTKPQGTDTINGFNLSTDVIELSAAAFPDFSAVQAVTAAIPPNAVIVLGPSALILLPGVNPSSLTAQNFRFV